MTPIWPRKSPKRLLLFWRARRALSTRRRLSSAWLCRTAHYAAADALKILRRRQRREQEIAHGISFEPNRNPNPIPGPTSLRCWTLAMAQLAEKDHCAIVLRFFEGKDLKQVGAALGVTENAAKTRVSRATEKFAQVLHQTGNHVVSSRDPAQRSQPTPLQAAPIGLATSVTVAAGQGTAVTTSTFNAHQNDTENYGMDKTQTAAGAGCSHSWLAGNRHSGDTHGQRADQHRESFGQNVDFRPGRLRHT